MNEDQADLELQLGSAEVALKQLVSAGSIFAALINEVAKSYAGTQVEPVEWLVELRPGSVKMPVRGRPSTELRATAIPELSAAIAEGLAALDERAERPDYFNDKALEQAKALANLASPDAPISVRNGREKAELSKRVAANVDDVLGAPLESYGTVEGHLEGLNLHGARPRFAVYEPLTGHRVECRFTPQVTLDDLRPAIGRRVGVRGEIKSRRNGVRVSVAARELRILGEEADLPSPDAVFGILRGYV
jgi:hypothetical protein